MNWMQNIQVGDVLRTKNGRMRIVRDVKLWKNGCGAVRFTIQRCSWTTRCYTVYNFNDLRTLGYRPTGQRLKLRSKFDRIMAEELFRAGMANKAALYCCDVIGIP